MVVVRFEAGIGVPPVTVSAVRVFSSVSLTGIWVEFFSLLSLQTLQTLHSGGGGGQYGWWVPLYWMLGFVRNCVTAQVSSSQV